MAKAATVLLFEPSRLLVDKVKESALITTGGSRRHGSEFLLTALLFARLAPNNKNDRLLIVSAIILAKI